jgi:hypothetical protein
MRRLTYRRHQNDQGRFVGVYLGKLFVGSYYRDDVWARGDFGETDWNTYGSSILVKDIEGTVSTESAARKLFEKKVDNWLRKNGLEFARPPEPETPLLNDWIGG